MSYCIEALVAVLVSAEALLRDAGWPACRGQPTVPVRIGGLAQLAGAVASVVDGAPEAPCGHQNGQSAVRACEQGIRVLGGVEDPGPPPAPRALFEPAYWCRDPACWNHVGTPDIYCDRHPQAIPRLGVWQRARLRAGVFAIPEEV